jgi:hypothetical protein
MNSLDAVHQNTEVVVRWTTESEVGILGFHVLCSGDEFGPFERISTAVIPCRGNSSSRTEYVFGDKNIENGKSYWYRIEELNTDGTSRLFGPVRAVSPAVEVLTKNSRLIRNYPNPFNPSTTIRYELSEIEAENPISLAVYNILGQKVIELVRSAQSPGLYSIDWNGCGKNGMDVPSGVYFCVLMTGNSAIRTTRMMKME